MHGEGGLVRNLPRIAVSGDRPFVRGAAQDPEAVTQRWKSYAEMAGRMIMAGLEITQMGMRLAQSGARTTARCGRRTMLEEGET